MKTLKIIILILLTNTTFAIDLGLKVKPPIKNDEKAVFEQQQTQINVLKQTLSAIPKITTLKNNYSEIYFLQNTIASNNVENTVNSIKSMKNAIEEIKKKYLGTLNGKKIYYYELEDENIQSLALQNNNDQNMGQKNNNNLTDHIVTYNKRTHEFSLFKGAIYIKVFDLSYLEELKLKYKLNFIYKNTAVIQLEDLNTVQTVYDELKNDSKVNKVEIQYEGKAPELH